MTDTAQRKVRNGRGLFAWRPALMVAFLGSVSLGAVGLPAAWAQSYSFSTVKIEGNNAVEAATILTYAGVAKGKEVSAGALNDAYQRLFNSGLFEKVELDPQGSTLVIRVTEYPVINVVNFEGNNLIKDEDLAKVAKSQGRRVYSPAQAEADAAAITELYVQRGRLAATVTPKIIRRDANRVDVVFEIAEGKVVENERISFVGNKSFSDRRLRQVLQTKQAGLLRQLIQRDSLIPERLELDKQLLRDFYLSRGFIDVEVLDASADLARERDANFITFTVREGQSYRIGKISTHSEVEGVDANEFAAVEKIKSGETYSPNLIDNNTQRLENLALRKSLNFITVEPKLTKNQADGTVDVDFIIKRGPKVFVERIDIQGNTTTMDQVIRRQFRTVEGDPFSPSEVRKAAERIKALGFFADSQVDTKPGTNPDQVIVDVNVTEQPTGTLSVGASYGVSSGFGVTLGFSEENFLGRGQYLSANIAKGTSTTDSGVNFAEPNFLGRDVKLKFGATYNQTNSDYSYYDTKTIAITPALEFPLTELTRLELRYKIGANDLYNVDSGSSVLLVSEAARGTQTVTGPGYSLTYDSRINGLNPKGGILLKLSQDYYGLGGDVDMIQTTGLAMAETKVGKEDTTLRAIFEGGFLLSNGGYETRVTDRFFGRGKIRGFEPNGIGPRDTAATNDDAVGGNYFAAVRLESEFPIGLPEEYGILGGLFFDAGSVWGLDNTTGTGTIDDSFHLRSAAGFSILWTTPIGPLRLNFSKALLKESYDKEQNFDLTIQTKF